MRGSARRLIVNADDFGRSPGITAGILQARRQGIVRSASLMVRWPAAAEAARLGRSQLDLGLHLDLGEWAYRDGAWMPVYEVVATDDATAVEREVRAQLELFRTLVGADPTHIDSHQHVHRDGVVAEIVDSLARPLRVPVRHRHPLVSYRGDFYGRTGRGEPAHEGITPEHLAAILRTLPVGITELACHPGLDDGADPLYDHERVIELGSLCDPRVRALIAEEGIVLQSFAELGRGAGWA